MARLADLKPTHFEWQVRERIAVPRTHKEIARIHCDRERCLSGSFNQLRW